MLSVNCRVEMLSVVFRVTTKGKTKKYIERNKGVKMIQKKSIANEGSNGGIRKRQNVA